MTKAERTRQFIVEKTAPLFNSKGFAGTSMSDITAATGLTKGSIYGNFASKDEVALAVFDYNLQQVLQIVRTEMEACTTSREKLLVYARVYAGFLKKPFPYGGCPVLNTAVEADDTHPALKERANKALLQWKSEIAGIVREGIKRKEFLGQTEPADLAITLIALIEGGIMITKLSGKSSYLQTVMRAIEKLIDELE